MQIVKDVYLVAGGNYGVLGNSYAIDYGEGIMLVDTSMPSAAKIIEENINYWMGDKPVTHVLLTHGHRDHAGSAKHFQEKGAKIILGKEDLANVEEGGLGPVSPFTHHTLPAVIPDILVDEDMVLAIGNLQVSIYKMPSHTLGSLLFVINVNEKEILFTGDMFFPDGETGANAFIGWKGDLGYSVENYLQSFKKLWLLALQPDVVLGGHGAPRIGKDNETIKEAYKKFLLENR